MTTKILTVRIPAPLYSSLCSNAAVLGVSVAAHVRRLVETEHNAEQVENLRAELLAKLDNLAATPAQSSEPDEMLLLTRAIAAHCNPQLVAQVRAKLANQQVGGNVR